MRNRALSPRLIFTALTLLLVFEGAAGEVRSESLRFRISFGHRGRERTTYSIRVLPGSPGMTLSGPTGFRLESDDSLGDPAQLHAGGGDTDGLEFGAVWTTPGQPPRKIHSLWQYLLDHGTPGQASRLRDEPALLPGSPVVTVCVEEDETRGFSIALDQLARQRAMWIPDHDAWVTLANAPAEAASAVRSTQGQRTMERVQAEPESSLAEFNARWEDVGNPIVWDVPWQSRYLGTRGHLVVTAAARGSLYKFAVDRDGRVRPDFASPHRFRLDPELADATWISQRIVDGLPIVLTIHERAGQRFEFEQFAAPFGPLPSLHPGEIPGVFFTRVRVTGSQGPARCGFALASDQPARTLETRRIDSGLTVVDRETGAVWLEAGPAEGWSLTMANPSLPRPVTNDHQHVELTWTGTVDPAGASDLVVKLFSPPMPPDGFRSAAAFKFKEARARVVRYWEDELARGSQFEVPERAINDLFRANLWHAMILPRYRVGDHGGPRIDLPYANTAYGQTNADWPVNQAVYVDYMLYGLRGYTEVAEEEFEAMFDTQQQPGGRIAGFANWGVYSPAQLYAIGKVALLADNGALFERLLPRALKTLNWCLGEVARARERPDSDGLIRAPLNDLTHEEREWAFTQAYFVAGLDTFGRALSRYHHPRADEVRRVAAALQADVERAFARASVHAPAVQLADGSWRNYVPSDAMTPRRMLEEWYPTDVDCGPLHLARLRVVDPNGWLATAMLNDHEDNLFLRQWGAANEPVYNPQATVYLLRDQPKAVIRAFYSMMACAFSHGQFSPIEHRWAWGQYYGPPSTDGAWFELYRNMMVREQGDGSLFIGQATPRAWLADGRHIAVDRAPTEYGPVSLRLESHSGSGVLMASVEFPGERRPSALVVRLRHPDSQPIRSVTVNGRPWQDFNDADETIRIPVSDVARFSIEAGY